MSHAIEQCYGAYVELFPVARKPHRCHACHEQIGTGQKYARVQIVFEGSAETVKRCLRCQKIHEHLRELDRGALWPDERLDCGEEYTEHWGKEPPPEIAALAFALPGEVESSEGGGAGG